MKIDNPFSLTFGMLPYQVIGRYEEKNNCVSMFTAENAVSHVFLIEGIRGSGKTVLMTAISEDLCQNRDWIGVDLNPTMDLLENLAESLSNEVHRLPDIFEKGFSVSFAGFGVGVNGGRQQSAIGVIEDVLDYLKKKGKKLVITIDEVMSSQNMRVFASQFQIFLRKGYPVFLIMTGLYENIYSIQNDDSLTFLLRSPKVSLAPLSLMQIAVQYEDIFSTDRETAMKMARETKGYAFAFQALGMLVWEKGIKSFQKADRHLYTEYDSLLDDFAYRKIWSELSKKEQEILLAMEDDRDMKASEISAASNISGNLYSQYRKKLLDKGLLISPSYGYVALALPRFKRVCSYYV